MTLKTSSNLCIDIDMYLDQTQFDCNWSEMMINAHKIKHMSDKTANLQFSNNTRSSEVTQALNEFLMHDFTDLAEDIAVMQNLLAKLEREASSVEIVFNSSNTEFIALQLLNQEPLAFMASFNGILF